MKMQKLKMFDFLDKSEVCGNTVLFSDTSIGGDVMICKNSQI